MKISQLLKISIILVFLTGSMGVQIAQAAFIASDGTSYTLNGNIIQTNEGLEWLQWTETVSSSIADVTNPAGSLFQAGWRVASNVQMSAVFNDFFLPLVWDTDESTTDTLLTPWDIPEDSPQSQFISLFGDTYNSCEQVGACFQLGIPADPFSYSLAFYGKDLNNNGLYNRADVRDDITRFFDNAQFGHVTELIEDDIGLTITRTSPDTGIALVRLSSPIPEPTVAALLFLGFVGLGFQTRKIST